MSDAYELVREGEPLNGSDIYRNIFSVMAQQTVECAYFISAYVKDSGFCEYISLIA